MVSKSRVLSEIAVAFEDAETIDSDHLQGTQVPGRVEVGMVRMAARYATEPVALSVSPVPLETHIATLRRLPGMFEADLNPVFFAILPDALLRGPIEPVRQTPVERRENVPRRPVLTCRKPSNTSMSILDQSTWRSALPTKSDMGRDNHWNGKLRYGAELEGTEGPQHVIYYRKALIETVNQTCLLQARRPWAFDSLQDGI